MSVNDEAVIWAAYIDGDEQSFRQLYNLYYKGLMNYGHRFTIDDELIESAIQDLFVRLWQKRAGMKPVSNVKNYLYVSFRHTLVRALSKAEVFQSISPNEEDYTFNIVFDPETILINRERMVHLQERLSTALGKMNPRQREVIYLKYYENLTYEEIATIMGISVKGTYKLMYRAIDTLREHLGQFLFTVLYLIVTSMSRPQ
jgi:RNA polymerase sigma factor (sigma-70 family)